MAKKFLTNDKPENTLSERITKLTHNSDQLDFLVGYFFFSGFCEICEELKDKPLRILIGMDADVDLNNCIVEYTTDIDKKGKKLQKQIIREQYYEKLKKIINKADLLDTADFAASYKIFLDKLDNGTLEVRKTKDPNHAKMYLFHIPATISDSGYEDGKVIIGSSNFSVQGFKARNEINVYLQEDTDYCDGKKIFDDLWDSSVPLINLENKDEFKKLVLEKTWLENVTTPYLMYIRVLYEYFKENEDFIKTPRELTHDRMNQFFDVTYQVDAIREGVEKVKKHSGCIVADVVGLGKSVIASAIAANLNKRVVIISPPHLKAQWEDYGADFGLIGYKVYTSGKIEEAALENKDCNNLVIIVDEAHRYRNENTDAYGALHQLCTGNQVILLSATPFNNKPEDIFALIKLFQIPEHSTIQTVDNLAAQMEILISDYKKLKEEHSDQLTTEYEFNVNANNLAEKIRDILDPVVIRRTRIDLITRDKYKKDLESQGIMFSKVNPPVSQNYDLGELSDLYIRTLKNLTGDDKNKIKGFQGARYKPLTYLKKDKKDKTKIAPELIEKYKKHFDDIQNFISGQRNMAKFIKQLLVRRFESSKYSFIKSLENILASMVTMRRWFLEAKTIPMAKNVKLPDLDDVLDLIGDDSDSLFGGTDEILKCELFKENEKGLWHIEAEDIDDNFLKDLDYDIGLIQGFIDEWKDTKMDPKLNCIIEKIKTSLKNDFKRKIIIFTEFSDTAEYLFDSFKKENIKVMSYSSKNANKANMDLIRSNFDAGYQDNMQKNDFDVLIATDAISEGFSLHRAGTIYNYDIPYNPTRVIQRVGRINRINKKVFDELYIYNFFPTTTGEKISHTAEISTFKMKLFQSILGADTQILTDDETIDGYLGKKFEEAEKEANTISWSTYYRNQLDYIKNNNKSVLLAAKKLPQRCRLARENINYNLIIDNKKYKDLFSDIDKNGVLLFSKKGDSYRFCFAENDGNVILLKPQQALALFEASPDEQGEKVSPNYYPLYERAKQNSGKVKSSVYKKSNINKAITNLGYLSTQTSNETEKNYLEDILNVVSLRSIPNIYIKKLANINVNDKNTIKTIMDFLPQNYLQTILLKDQKIDSAPETILLSEELK